jgi:hypothetical protein
LGSRLKVIGLKLWEISHKSLIEKTGIVFSYRFQLLQQRRLYAIPFRVTHVTPHASSRYLLIAVTGISPAWPVPLEAIRL